MPTLICSKTRTARKEHSCDYCNDVIKKNELYNHDTLKYCGEIHNWKSHTHCKFIAQELWEYIDPWDGMHDDDFQEGCRDFCREFVCPYCDKYDCTLGGCSIDEYCCLDKVYDILKKYELVKEVKYPHSYFRLRPRNVIDEGDR